MRCFMKSRGVNIAAINASWGGYGYDQLLKDVIEAAGDAGILFVAAAGNEGNNNDLTPLYPCSYDLPNIICVGATDRNDQKPDWSNSGFGTVDIGTPGVDILSTLPGRGYLPQAGDIFLDDMESGPDNWTTGGTNDTWATTEEESHSPTHSWSDNPNANYPNNTDSRLAVKNDIDLSSHQDENVVLGFWTKYEAESGYDYLSIELSDDGGAAWKEVGRITGSNSNFELITAPVTREFRTASFRFRFHLLTNGNATKNGFYIDDEGIGIGEASNTYAEGSGTSMASPHVTGAVALMVAEYSTENICHQLGRIFAGVNVKDQFQDLWWSSGRLNLYNSITGTHDPVVTSVSPADGMTPGTQFTITGCSFGDSLGQALFTTGTTETQATVVSWSDTSITASVPAGTGKYVRVARDDGRRSNPEKVSSWYMTHALNTAGSDAAAVAYNGRIYVFGGFSGNTYTNTAEVYDPVTDTWTDIAPMTIARASLSAAEAGGKIYVIGGHNNNASSFLDTVEAYDPGTNTWETKAPLPKLIIWMKAVSLNGKIYVTGGYDGSNALNTLYEYDPTSDTWTQKASMNQARLEHGTVALGGKIYVFGGGDDPGYLNSAEVYDSTTGNWNTISNMPLALARMGAATGGQKVYMAGGTNSYWWWGYLPIYMEYEPATDSYFYEERNIKELITSKSTAPLVFVLEENALFSVAGLGSGATSLDEVERMDLVIHTLTISPVLAHGTVKVPQDGSQINCGSSGTDCTTDYADGTDVTLYAEADAGYALSNWQGDCSSCRGISCTITMDADRTCSATFVLDSDGDGVGNVTEDNAPNSGDGNGDGTLDKDQPVVTSLPSAAGQGYVTVVVSSCSQNSNVQTYTEDPDDPGYTYPFGLVGFELPNCGIATVRVYFHGATSLNGYIYRKYGPTTPGDDATTAWYTLPGVTYGTATIGGQTVAYAEFTLTDGQLGDDTGADSTIVDQGGPGQPVQGAAPTSSVPTMNQWGMVIFGLLLAMAALLRLRGKEHL